MSSFPTPQQALAIHNRGALLVSAAAGSGKTAVLVERVVQCVLDPNHPTDVNRLLVVTFTNAAADEMKQRIRTRLAEELENDPGNERLTRQQMLLDKANISTIDAFCKNLAADHFDVLGISPECRIMPESALAIVKANAMEQTLNAFLEAHPAAFEELAGLLGAVRDTQAVADAIETIYTFLRSLPYPRRWTDGVRRQYRVDTDIDRNEWGRALRRQALQTVCAVADALSRGAERLADDPVVKAKRGPALQTAADQWTAAAQALRSAPWDEAKAVCDGLCKPVWNGRLPNHYESPQQALSVRLQQQAEAGADRVHALIAYTAAQCAEQCRCLQGPVDLLLDAVWDYADRIDRKKAEEGSWDFSDYEYAALRLLAPAEDGTPAPLADAICDRFDYVLVDEFQDVNDLQSAIFNAVSRGGRNLFTVGDMKQSIYRFRKANPRNFLQLLQTYPTYTGAQNPGKVVLAGNFRSRPGVCQTVNDLFSLCLSPAVGDIDYTDGHQLIPMAEFPASEACPVTLDFLQKDPARSAVEREADRIAWHIRQAMAEPCVTDRKTGVLRPARPGDCVVLLRGVKNKGEAYADRLRAHGIPAVTERSSGLLDQPEVAKVLALLRVIDNPTDDVSLLSCMMSPLFGFSADDVAGVRGEHKKLPLYLSVEQAAQSHPLAANLTRALADLRAYAATVTPDRLLLRIYDRYGYASAVQAMENGAQRKANLLALLELARDCARNGYDRLDGLLRYVRRVEEGKVTLPPPPVADGLDAVRIMTIHHAKGLQFSLCFVADCGSSGGREKGALLLDEQLGLGLTMVDDERRVRIKTCMRAAVAAENRRADWSEELRVLYVAMTRAIDRLYMITTLNDVQKAVFDASADLQTGLQAAPLRIDPALVLAAGHFGRLLLYYALLHPAGEPLRALAPETAPLCALAPSPLAVCLPDEADIPLPAPAAAPAPAADEPDVQNVLALLDRRLGWQDPYAPLYGVFSKRSVSQLAHGEAVDTGDLTARPAFLQADGLTAAEKGTALHAFMQYADYASAAADADGEIDRLVQAAFLTPVQAKAIDRQRLARFFAGPLYARMAASPRVLREQRFLAALPVTRLDPQLPARFADETVVVQGIADCVFEEDGRLVIVDYKTDRVSQPAQLVERYAAQLRLYGELLGADLGLPVKELLLYSFALNAVIPLPDTEANT